MSLPDGQLEWLERGPYGSFALGCVDRRLRRKYHALLTVREPGHGDAWNVLAEVHEEVGRDDGPPVLLCDVVSGPNQSAHGDARLTDFASLPCVTHRYRVGAHGLAITRAVRIAGDQVELRYEVRGVDAPMRLALAPLLRCRALHALTFENPFLDGSCTEVGEGTFRMQPYAGMPAVLLQVRADEPGTQLPVRFARDGHWLLGPFYPWEAARGYEAREHLFTPGRLVVTLDRDAAFTLTVGLDALAPQAPWPALLAPPARETFAHKLARATRGFLMRTRGGATTVVAGLPWFGPSSRDALLALPGLYLSLTHGETQRSDLSAGFDEAAAVLESLLDARVDGLIASQPALGDAPAAAASVEASLLFARAVQWLGQEAGADKVERFMPAVCELLEAIADARDGRMRFDHGVGVWITPGPWALTWMDATVDGQAVTPRAGYAVELDALAYNAARFATQWARAHASSRFRAFERAFRTRLRHAEADFLQRYWDDTRGYLADGHDGERPRVELRPNQLFALGLPERPLDGAMARSCLEAVTRALVVPAGLRTLAPGASAYAGRYQRDAQVDPRARELAYHQGTVWPWWVGIYADAVQAVHGHPGLEARLAPLFTFFARHLDQQGCLGQISEIFDGDAPHLPHGAPAHAASAAELYRALRLAQRPP